MRVRVRFAKTEAMRFTGHLDLFRTWERTIRRASLPLSYTQGLSPASQDESGCCFTPGIYQ